MTDRPSVLFVCVHNAGRSQMAAGFLTHLGGDRVEVRSAGSMPGDQVNPAAVAAMAEVGIDISRASPKILTTEAVQASDVVITMGCGDACPIFPGKRYLDWALEDPAGQGVEAVRPIRDEIRARIEVLLSELRDSTATTPVKRLTMAVPENIRETVRERYAAAAVAIDSPAGTTEVTGTAEFGAALYDDADLGAAPLAGSLGCGVPTAVADLQPGEVVLDLGSGAGGDVLLSARRVAPGGRAIGLDMTEEMLTLARRNAAEAGVDNVEFLQGYLEDIPLGAGTVDVVISNCVINLAADKTVVLAEAARVLRPGGRLAISDVVADSDLDEETRADVASWTGCIAGALTHTEFTDALSGAGFSAIEIRPTHRVHAHAQAAVIRAIR